MIKKKWKKGNGVLIFGTAFMMIALLVVIMFTEIFGMYQDSAAMQLNADTMSDALAVYIQTNPGKSDDDVAEEAEKIRKLINKKSRIQVDKVRLDKDAMEEDQTVRAELSGVKTYSASYLNQRSMVITRVSGTKFSSYFGDAYIQWAIAFAADDEHGYAQGTEDHEPWGSRLCDPDVDCSSFVYYSLLNTGYTKADLGSYPFTTSTMGSILVKNGFKKVKFSKSDLRVGDILVNPGSHTEMYIGNGQTVGAHGDRDGKAGDSSGKEVSIVKVKTFKWIYRKV